MRGCPDDAWHVMIVGHNPGLQELAVMLARPGGEELARIEEKLPTAAIVTFEFETERWKDLQPEAGASSFSSLPPRLRLEAEENDHDHDYR